MRTTLDIEDRLIDALMARYPAASMTGAIETAIAARVADDAAAWLRPQAGTVAFDGAPWRAARADS